MSDEIERGAAEPLAAGQSQAATEIEQIIERWWQDHFPGSAIARDTLAWNVAHDAKETLKRLLVQTRDQVFKGSM
jgi:hypothetical protein